jgi:hypothetical protein
VARAVRQHKKKILLISFASFLRNFFSFGHMTLAVSSFMGARSKELKRDFIF